MSTEVILPKMGFSMIEGAVSQWLVASGAAVEAGAPLYVLESEKSAEEVESPASGKLRILVQSGATVPVGTVLAVIE
jgi:pyruvate/2-oxoglutarate dehydrogenase complex dihydrolipoamide acyltransferase (E2) component